MPSDPSGPAAPAGRRDPLDLLREVRATLSAIYHDANNPLAIISGNAQFLLELSRVMELDEDVVQPLRDIEEASQRVAEKLRELARLKEEIARYVADASAA